MNGPYQNLLSPTRRLQRSNGKDSELWGFGLFFEEYKNNATHP